MANLRTKFQTHPWRSLLSLALMVAGVWLLGGWLSLEVTSPVIPFGLVIGGMIIASSPLPGHVVTGLLIMIMGLFLGLRMAGIVEVPWIRYITSFLLIGSGLWYFLANDKADLAANDLPAGRP